MEGGRFWVDRCVYMGSGCIAVGPKVGGYGIEVDSFGIWEVECFGIALGGQFWDVSTLPRSGKIWDATHVLKVDTFGISRAINKVDSFGMPTVVTSFGSFLPKDLPHFFRVFL